jgi:hypothetical protein
MLSISFKHKIYFDDNYGTINNNHQSIYGTFNYYFQSEPDKIISKNNYDNNNNMSFNNTSPDDYLKFVATSS